jgi:hypothetical protein
MVKSRGAPVKKRGRPATGTDPLLNFRAPGELTARIDAWRAARGEPPASRSEAIRQLIELGLAKGRAVPREMNRVRAARR